MSFFTAVQEAAAQGRTVQAALFVMADFSTTPRYFWEGDGPITVASQTWEGLGPIADISGIEQAVNGAAPQLVITLSGVDSAIVTVAKASSSEVEGRALKVYLQFFADGVASGPFSQIGEWIMQRPRFSASGPSDRSITLVCETLWTQRSRAPFAMLTSADQAKRYSGDKGLDFVPLYVEQTVQWPRD